MSLTCIYLFGLKYLYFFTSNLAADEIPSLTLAQVRQVLALFPDDRLGLARGQGRSNAMLLLLLNCPKESLSRLVFKAFISNNLATNLIPVFDCLLPLLPLTLTCYRLPVDLQQNFDI